MFRVIAVLALLTAGGSAWAQQDPADSAQAALDQLKDANDSGMGPVADGGGAKDNGNGTVTVGVEKNIRLNRTHVPAHRTCTRDVGTDDGRYGARTCDDQPEHTVTSFGDREHVQITDRDKYKSSQGGKWAGWGALIGGLIGALGFLTLLIPGVGVAAGVAIGLVATAVGAGAGAGIGYLVASNDASKQPEKFTKDDEKWTETTYP